MFGSVRPAESVQINPILGEQTAKFIKFESVELNNTAHHSRRLRCVDQFAYQGYTSQRFVKGNVNKQYEESSKYRHSESLRENIN